MLEILQYIPIWLWVAVAAVVVFIILKGALTVIKIIVIIIVLVTIANMLSNSEMVEVSSAYMEGGITCTTEVL